MRSLTRFYIAFFACSVLALTTFAGPEALPTRDSKDKEVMAAPAPSCDYSWAGFYIGVNAGYGWGNADTSFDPLPTPGFFFDLLPQSHDADPDGMVGGGQIGFNYQWNWLVAGAEADFQGSDMSGTKRVSPFLNDGGVSRGPDSFLFTRERTDWFGTFRGRIGFTPWCRLLIYGTGGLAYGNVHYAADVANPPSGEDEAGSLNRTSVGWTAGGGFEYMLTHHWTVKVEYLYYDLGDHGTTGPETINGLPAPPFGVHYNFETTANIVRCGINFKF